MVNVNYAAYFPCIADLRERWADRISIKTGLEFGVQMHTIPQFNTLWDKYADEFDFTLLSIHQVGDLEFWTGEFQEGRSQEAYNRAYYQELYDVTCAFEHWSVLAHVDLIKRYDPAGILDSDNWIKGSVEYEDGVIQHLGSVVTNHGWSDWATTEIPAEKREMWYRLSHRAGDYRIDCSEDGESWHQMRVCHLHEGAGTVRVGIYACSPEDSSFTARFDHLDLGPCAWLAHDGQQPDEE